jgi:hypothetical protein
MHHFANGNREPNVQQLHIQEAVSGFLQLRFVVSLDGDPRGTRLSEHESEPERMERRIEAELP